MTDGQDRRSLRRSQSARAGAVVHLYPADTARKVILAVVPASSTGLPRRRDTAPDARPRHLLRSQLSGFRLVPPSRLVFTNTRPANQHAPLPNLRGIYFFIKTSLGMATRTGACRSVTENGCSSSEVRTQIICGAPLANWTSTGTSIEKSSSTPVCATAPESLTAGAAPLTV